MTDSTAPATDPATADEAAARAPVAVVGYEPVAPPSVGQRAARGMAWMTLASLLAKVVGFAQLIVLARFLRVEDFGLLAMANTVIAFVVVPLRFGVDDVLIQRQRRFDLWVGPAFWLSMATGAAMTALILLAAPVGAWFYGDWHVAGLMATFALAVPLTASAAVPTARLSADLRFRAIAAMTVAQIVVQTVVSIPLAWLGVGAMSVATASLASALVLTVGYWRLAKVGPLGRPRARRWRYLLGDTGLLQGVRLATAVANNVDFVTVGRLGGAGPLGVYSYAYNQSLQAMRLVASNAAGVLFPSLTSLGDDPARKYAAWLRGMRLVLPLLVPFCALQAALADPGFRLLFKPEYWPGIRLFQLLSLGAAGVGVCTLCHSFLMSLRRNGLTLANAAGSAGIFVVAAPLGWAIGRTMGVTVAMTLGSFASVALAHVLAARGANGSLAPAARLYGRPTLLAVLSCAPVWWIAERALPEAGPMMRLIAGTAAFAALYPPLLWALCRETFAQLAARLPRRRTSA